MKKDLEEDLTTPYLTKWTAITLQSTMPRMYAMAFDEAVKLVFRNRLFSDT